MLKTMVASKAAKLLAACVCPVAGTVAVTMAVPQVRSAVHNATAPRAHAKPKTRARQPQTAQATPPCTQTAMSGGILFTPTDIGNFSFAPPALSDIAFTNGTPIDRLGRRTLPGAVLVPDEPTPADILTPNPSVPEPETWVQMLLGFGLLGGVVRMTMRNDKRDAAEA